MKPFIQELEENYQATKDQLEAEELKNFGEFINEQKEYKKQLDSCSKNQLIEKVLRLTEVARRLQVNLMLAQEDKK